MSQGNQRPVSLSYILPRVCVCVYSCLRTSPLSSRSVICSSSGFLCLSSRSSWAVPPLFSRYVSSAAFAHYNYLEIELSRVYNDGGRSWQAVGGGGRAFREGGLGESARRRQRESQPRVTPDPLALLVAACNY